MTIQAVFVDLDGTLVDSNAHHVAAWAKAFAEAGHDVPQERIRSQIGKGGDNLVPALMPGLGEAAQKRLSARHGDIFTAEHIGQVRPFAGAHDLLVRLAAAGKRLVFASSGSDNDIDHDSVLLDAVGLVDAKTTADDVAHSKPAGDIFAAALAKVAPLSPKNIMVIGDTPYDVEAARRCGIDTIAVRSGGFDDAALAGAIGLYDDVAALLAVLDRSPLA